MNRQKQTGVQRAGSGAQRRVSGGVRSGQPCAGRQEPEARSEHAQPRRRQKPGRGAREDVGDQCTAVKERSESPARTCFQPVRCPSLPAWSICPLHPVILSSSPLIPNTLPLSHQIPSATVHTCLPRYWVYLGPESSTGSQLPSLQSLPEIHSPLKSNLLSNLFIPKYSHKLAHLYFPQTQSVGGYLNIKYVIAQSSAACPPEPLATLPQRSLSASVFKKLKHISYFLKKEGRNEKYRYIIYVLLFSY